MVEIPFPGDASGAMEENHALCLAAEYGGKRK
jgi:hypothetical protein